MHFQMQIRFIDFANAAAEYFIKKMNSWQNVYEHEYECANVNYFSMAFEIRKCFAH